MKTLKEVAFSCLFLVGVFVPILFVAVTLDTTFDALRVYFGLPVCN